MTRTSDKKTITIWKNLYFLYFLGCSLWAFTVSNVMRSSWSGDDWPNSQTPYWIKWRYGTISPLNVLYEAQYWNNQWMQGAGRFYPLAWIESRFAFTYFRELWQYKLLQTSVLMITGLLFVTLIFKLSRSHSLALLTLVFLSITIQFRRDFDPHLAFAFMVPSLLSKVFISSILAYHSSMAKKQLLGILYSILSGMVLFLAMSTYEYAFLLFPIVIVSFFAGIMQSKTLTVSGGIETARQIYRSRESWRVLPVILSWIGYGVYVFGFLRTKATAISGAYVLGFSWKSITTFISQLIPPWPLTVFKSSDLFNVDVKSNTLLIGALVAIVGTYFLYGLIANSFTGDQIEYFHKTKGFSFLNLAIVLVAADLFLSPAFMLSIQPEWWGRASVTHSYLGILIQEFGAALLLSLLVTFFIGRNLKLTAPRGSKQRRRK